jgi:hypothetical protein
MALPNTCTFCGVDSRLRITNSPRMRPRYLQQATRARARLVVAEGFRSGPRRARNTTSEPQCGAAVYASVADHAVIPQRHRTTPMRCAVAE